MRFGTNLLLTFFLVVLHALAQQNNPPQRTITTRPDNPAPSDQKAAPDMFSGSAAGLQRYREMWQRMTPAQQKAMVSAGGYTPEQYERMLSQKGIGGAEAKGGNPSATPDSARGTDSGVLDSLSKSLQDLNAIRDANLSLVQKKTCAPELAMQIAGLKETLHGYEFELNGPEARATEQPDAAAAMAIAADWFKRQGDARPAASSDGDRRTRESSQLDAVLTGAETAETRGDPKSSEAERSRKMIEADIARAKAELEQLSAACAGKK